MARAFDLERFVQAQAGGELQDALGELRAGHKRSHWIWYVFPQLAGLGSSSMAARYGLDGVAEARAYLQHPTLRAALAEAVSVVHAQLCERGAKLRVLMGAHIDALKLVSSMTLFEHVAGALAKEEPAADLTGIASQARAILAAAAAQGYPECAFTRSHLR